MTKPEINRELASRVLKTVEKGLSGGLGNPKPGQMCVEAAVCYAMGLPHSDKPPCVGSAVRRFKIALNDKKWSSKEVRAEGMKALAIAQLGSDQIDQHEFLKLVAKGTIQQIVPVALRAVAKLLPNYAGELEAAAKKCEADGTRAAALEARDTARRVRQYAAAYADAYATAAYAAAAAYADAYAAADAADAGRKAKIRDEVLKIAANIGLQALITLKSPGCEFLDLIKS